MKTIVNYNYNDWIIESQLYHEIGRRIRAARRLKDFTQQDLSDRVRLSRTSITNIENGVHKISLYTLYEICFVLDLEIHKLIPNNIKDKETSEFPR